MEFIVVNNNKGNAKYYFYVHRKGCKSIRLEEKKFASHGWSITGNDVNTAIQAVLEEFHRNEQGYSQEDFYISACLKNRKKVINMNNKPMKDQILEFFQITDKSDYEEFDKYIILKRFNKDNYPTVRILNTNARKLFNCQVQAYRFTTEQQREDHIKQFKKNIEDQNEWKAQRQFDKKNFVNPAQVGDILDSNWGYEQTNIDFYQVIAVKGKSVVIREIAQAREQGEYWMTGTCMPIKDHFKGQPMLKRVFKSGNEYGVTIASYTNAYLWDGQKKHWTAYA